MKKLKKTKTKKPTLEQSALDAMMNDPEGFISRLLGMKLLSKETNLVLSVQIPSKNKAFIDLFRDTTFEERKKTKKNTALHAFHITYDKKKGIQIALAKPQFHDVEKGK